MYALKLSLFAIGTCGFFVAVYLATQHPELVESPQESSEPPPDIPERKWDKIATWVMWVGWGCAAFITFLDRSGFLDRVE